VERLRRRIGADDQDPAAGVAEEAGLRWAAVRDAVGLQVTVVLQEFGRLFELKLRDAVAAQGKDIKWESGRLARAAAQDQMGRGRPPP
jgi:hypothetical protein